MKSQCWVWGSRLQTLTLAMEKTQPQLGPYLLYHGRASSRWSQITLTWHWAKVAKP